MSPVVFFFLFQIYLHTHTPLPTKENTSWIWWSKLKSMNISAAVKSSSLRCCNVLLWNIVSFISWEDRAQDTFYDRIISWMELLSKLNQKGQICGILCMHACWNSLATCLRYIQHKIGARWSKGIFLPFPHILCQPHLWGYLELCQWNHWCKS